MNETKQAFSIDKPGAYKTRSGVVVDIVDVNQHTAAGWYRSDIMAHPIKAWNRNGCYSVCISFADIIEAIPFVVDGPGRYMMRDGRVAMVDQMNRQDGVSEQRIGGWYKSTADGQKTDTSWHVDGAWYTIKGIDNNRDLVRKIHPLEQEPGAKASEEQKAPEIKKPSEAPTFRIDTPGVYRTRDGRLVDIEGVGNNAVGTFVADPLYHHFWNLDGRTTSGLEASSDIIQKIKSKHPEPPAIGSRDKTAAEVANVLDKPVFKITEPGVYCTRNGRVVNIHEVTNTTAHGHWKVSGNKREWPLNGRTHASIDLGSDIVMKAPTADGVLKITDVLTRLRTDWDRRLAEQEELARKNSRGPKTPKTPPPVHLVVPGIEGKPTQQPSEEQLKLAYAEPPKPVIAKKPIGGILHPGKYRTRDGRLATITRVGISCALGSIGDNDPTTGWMLDGRFNEHHESGEDIVEKIEMSAYEGASDKWTKEEMDLLGAAAVEPKKRSAGFDLVIIRLNEQKCMLVVGDYENDDGDVKVRPIDYLDPAYVQRKCPDAIILQGDSYMVCPDTNVTCVIHYGGEE